MTGAEYLLRRLNELEGFVARLIEQNAYKDNEINKLKKQNEELLTKKTKKKGATNEQVKHGERVNK